MSYTVTIYQNSSNPNVMTKSLSGATNVTCEFKKPIDVENPEIYISAADTYDKYKYCYISEFGRYYYMKCIGGTSQTLTFQCTSDPLMSFKSAILASNAVIARNPWKYDLYVPDPKMPMESRTVRGTYKFTGNHFSGSNNTYVLTTLGSGSST